MLLAVSGEVDAATVALALPQGAATSAAGTLSERAAAFERETILGGSHAAGISAGGGDDCDRLRLSGLGLAQTLPGLTQLGGDPLEMPEQLVFV